MSEAYAAACAGGDPSLPALPVEYADYTVWLERQAAAREPMLAFWKQRLADLPVLALPTDFRRPSVQSFRGATVTADPAAAKPRPR